MNPLPIHACNPGPMTGFGNWTWLLPGRVTTLIDAGIGEPRHLQALEKALGGGPLHQVIVTHGHTDHALGAPALAERFPGVRFLKLPWPEHDGRYHVQWEAISAATASTPATPRWRCCTRPGMRPITSACGTSRR